MLERIAGRGPRAARSSGRLRPSSTRASRSTPARHACVAAEDGDAELRADLALRALYYLVPVPARRPAPLLRVPFRPPLDWEPLLAFLAARAVPGIERIEPGAYVRAITTSDGPTILQVGPATDGRALEVRLDPPRPGARAEVAARVRWMFDLETDPGAVAAALGRDRLLSQSLRARPGLRVPGGWDPFEVLVRAVIGQQISVAGARQLAGRIAAGCGETLPAGLCSPGLNRQFPAPAALAAANPAALPLPRARGSALVALASAVAAGELVLASRGTLDASLDALRGRPGLGPWTAQIVAMRGLRERDAFPAGDLGVRRALGHPGPPVPEADALARAEAWRPWRAYAAQHLWALDAER